MKRWGTASQVGGAIGVALLASLALVAALGWAVPVQARSAGRTFTLEVDHVVLNSGHQLTVTGRSNRPCVWLIDWHGDRRSAHAATFTTTYVAPQVTKTTRIVVHGTCFYTAKAPPVPRSDAPGHPAAGRLDVQTLVVFVPPSWHHDITVIVVPAGAVVSAPGGIHIPSPGLPNTGGPALWLLVAGALATISGSVVASRARRADQPIRTLI